MNYPLGDVIPAFSAPLQSRLRLPSATATATATAVPRFSAFDPVPPRTGAAAGEHNADIYGGIGLQTEDSVRLRQAGVI